MRIQTAREYEKELLSRKITKDQFGPDDIIVNSIEELNAFLSKLGKLPDELKALGLLVPGTPWTFYLNNVGGPLGRIDRSQYKLCKFMEKYNGQWPIAITISINQKTYLAQGD